MVVAIAISCLLVIAALVLDVGFAYAVGRQDQNVADMSALAGAPARRHGPFAERRLRRSKLHRLIPELSAMTAGERAGLPGVSTGRSVQIVAGALVADVVMKALSIDLLDISPWALREGVLTSRLDGLADPDQIHANRLVSAAAQHVEHDARESDGVTAMAHRRR